MGRKIRAVNLKVMNEASQADSGIPRKHLVFALESKLHGSESGMAEQIRDLISWQNFDSAPKRFKVCLTFSIRSHIHDR